MQEPHDRDDHHPARLIRGLAVALAALAAAAPAAAAGHFAALPSPAAPLSPAPPLGGGAAASSENVRHKIDARTIVQIGVDRTGAPFRVVATQRLDVRVLGDYFFTIGAPVLDVFRAAGSAADPGLRTGSIVWAGFDPGRRVLAARAILDSAQAAPSLPLRITVEGPHTVLTNVTGVDAGAFSANAEPGPLLAFLARLHASVRQGFVPFGGSIVVTSTPVATRYHVVAPLRVVGTVGARRVSVVLRGRTVVPAVGAVHLSVTPIVSVDTAGASSLDGRALLARVMRTTLTVARGRQYQSFLGNPDPTGRNDTTFVFRTAERPTASNAPTVHARHGRRTTLITLVAAALALGAAVVVWARA